MNNYTPTSSTQNTFLILDFTSTVKTGKAFEWSDFLWDEETDQPDKRGYEQAVALEVDPHKKFRKALGFRRFYHQEVLKETEYSNDDFEKKGVVVSRLLKNVCSHTKAKEVLVDGEFVHGFLIHRFEELGLA